ncbi:MAG: RibD family protein [Pseudomonadota bacterium]
MQDEAWKLLLDGADVAEAEVREGALEAVFAPLLQARAEGRRFVVSQLGLSLDGRIATETGDSKYINGRCALTHLHRLRALVDAVVIGAGTARADDPRLTVRLCQGAHPARVVIDPRGTVGPGAQVWREDGCRRIVIGGHETLPAGVERIDLSGQVPVAEIVAALDCFGLTRLLIEGGADTLGRFLADDAVDSLHLLFGRVLIGSGRVGVALPPIARLADAPRPEGTSFVFPDGDLLVTCDLKEG